MRPTAYASPKLSPMPIAPPNVASTSDSTRNWSRISLSCAPSALRRPISRVRSVTETSMMFMMPMPPTSRLMAPMLPRKTVNVCDTSLATSSRLA